MTPRNSSEYPEPAGSEHSSDRKQNIYPGAEQKEIWQEENRVMNFTDKLQLLNTQLAEKIDYRSNPMQEAQNHSDDIIKAFNSMEFNSQNWERQAAADELAKTMFQDIQKSIERKESAFHIYVMRKHSWHDEMIDREARLEPNPLPSMEHLLAQAELDHRQEKFASALYQSNQPAEIEDQHGLEIEQALHQPMTYPPDHSENHQDRLFEWLKENKDTFTQKAVERIVNANWYEADIISRQMYRQSDSNCSYPTVNTIKLAYGDQIMETFERDDLESFKKLTEQMPERNLQFFEKMKINDGFSQMPDGHRPEFPDRFDRLSQAEYFGAQIQDMAQNYNNPQHFPNPDIRTAIEYKIKEFNRELGYQKTIEDEIPERAREVTFRESARFEYAQKLVKELKYMTRPKDPEFWNLVDAPNDGTDQIGTAHIVEDKTRATLEAIAQLPDESQVEKRAAQSAHNALAHVYDMNIKSDLIDDDHTGYQAHVKEMKSRSEEFAKALREGTGFIEAPGYEEQPFPQWDDQSGSYLASVDDKLRELNLHEEIETDHYKAVALMIQEYQRDNQKILLTDISDNSEEARHLLREQEDRLRGIRILMRPKSGPTY